LNEGMYFYTLCTDGALFIKRMSVLR